MDFNDIDNIILNRIQKDLPLKRDMYDVLAREMSIEKDELLKRLLHLKEQGIVRNIAGIFNASSLGYSSSLVAFKVSPDRIEHAAGIINAHPGVSHNYLRDHQYNIWFTLAVDDRSKLADTVDCLARESEAEDSIILKNEKLFKIGLQLHVGRGKIAEEKAPDTFKKTVTADPRKLDINEIEAVRMLQCDLPLEDDPFHLLAVLAGSTLSADEILAYGNSFKESGIMRRYSAVLRHRMAGYTSNAMTVWKFNNDQDTDKAAVPFREHAAISHLYLRTVIPGKWEFPLFAMIHARDDDELGEIVQTLSDMSGITDYEVLKTVKEFKKERVSYFTEKFNTWDKQAGL